jgi:hypothetical protein
MKHISHYPEPDQHHAASLSQKSQYVRFPAAGVTHDASRYKELAIKTYNMCREVNYRWDILHCFSEDVQINLNIRGRLVNNSTSNSNSNSNSKSNSILLDRTSCPLNSFKGRRQTCSSSHYIAVWYFITAW